MFDISKFFNSIIDKTLDAFSARNIPFFVVVLSLSILGMFFSRKVWTKERAYAKDKSAKFFKLMRDTQVLHPMLAGAVWLAIWKDPMDYGWDAGDAFSYGLMAGAFSLFPWVAAKMYMKRSYNVDLEDYLPGMQSSHPGPIEEAAVKVMKKADSLADAVGELKEEQIHAQEPPGLE